MVGLGRILVARRAFAFDMKVLAFDRFVSAEFAAALGVSRWTQGLLGRADFITLHVARRQDPPPSEQGARLAKPGARLVNCARGA